MSGTRLFGTDGIRGPAGQKPLDATTISALASALGRQLTASRVRPHVVLGGDTRESTAEITSRIAGGLTAEGVEVEAAGVLPTPGVAALVRELGADLGIAVSASHNPWTDNGIKLIGADGFKWPDALEEALERELLALAESPSFVPSEPLALNVDARAVERYLDRLLAIARDSDVDLARLHLVLDTGHGAASALAGSLFERLGARVDILGDQPNGRNINEGVGSTHPEVVAARVRALGADLGLAFDGDADRCIVVDEQGEVRDGDAILYLWGRHLDSVGRLPHHAIVATSMSNLGLVRALAHEGIRVVRCGVGDREVVETMRKEGINLGGEQSGHIVNLGVSTTGDGLLTAMAIAGIVARGNESLSERLSGFRRFPQVLLNVRVREKQPFDRLDGVAEAVRAVEEKLGEDGRLVLRYSGTEPLARVMIEGPEQEEIEALAHGIANRIRAAAGAL